MAIQKTVTQNSQQGVVEATASSASGSAVITFNYVWDELEKKPLSYAAGRIMISDAVVAEFAYQNKGTMSIQTYNYAKIAEYATMVGNAISELESSLR